MNIAKCLLLGLLAGCSGCYGGTSGGSGHLGEGCRQSVFGANPCDAGLVCKDLLCLSCGDPGEPCCGLRHCPGTTECRAVDGEHVCADCGEPGEACCPSDHGVSCADGVHCDITTNICEMIMAPVCAGSTTRVYWGRYSNGCASLIEGGLIVTADDPSVAEDCARVVLGTSDVRTEPPTTYEMCEESPFFVCESQSRSAYSASDAASCSAFVCGTSCQIQAGTCPGTGRCLSSP